MHYQTVLFDLDGTLLDSNALIRASFEYTLDQYRIPYTDEEIQSYNGPPLWETFHKLNPGKEEEMIRTYRTHNHKNHDDYVKLYPNVLETLEALKKDGIKMGIVTSKMREGVKLALSLTGLGQYADTVVTIDDITHSKPHPESVIKAMTDLNSDAKTSVMVGDNYHDIIAGKNAGIDTVGVRWSHNGPDYLLQYEPTYMINDMLDMLKIVRRS